MAETSLFAARSPRNIASVCMGEMTALFVGGERGARGGSGTVRGGGEFTQAVRGLAKSRDAGGDGARSRVSGCSPGGHVARRARTEARAAPMEGVGRPEAERIARTRRPCWTLRGAATGNIGVRVWSCGLGGARMCDDGAVKSAGSAPRRVERPRERRERRVDDVIDARRRSQPVAETPSRRAAPRTLSRRRYKAEGARRLCADDDCRRAGGTRAARKGANTRRPSVSRHAETGPNAHLEDYSAVSAATAARAVRATKEWPPVNGETTVPQRRRRDSASY